MQLMVQLCPNPHQSMPLIWRDDYAVARDALTEQFDLEFKQPDIRVTAARPALEE